MFNVVEKNKNIQAPITNYENINKPMFKNHHKKIK